MTGWLFWFQEERIFLLKYLFFSLLSIQVPKETVLHFKCLSELGLVTKKID